MALSQADIDFDASTFERIFEIIRTAVRSLVLFVCVTLTACAGSNGAKVVPSSLANPAASSGKIQHIVMIVQENRSVDNLFATFPGADGATSGYYLKKVNGKYVKTKSR